MTNKEHGLSNILKPAVAMYWEAALKGQNQWPRWRLDHQPWWSYQLKTLAIPKPPLNTNLRAAMKEGRKKKNQSKWEGKREREKKREKGTTLPLRQTRGKTKAKHLFSLHFPMKLKPITHTQSHHSSLHIQCHLHHCLSSLPAASTMSLHYSFSTSRLASLASIVNHHTITRPPPPRSRQPQAR